MTAIARRDAGHVDSVHKHLYGVPYSVSGLAMGMDVQRYIMSPRSLLGDQADERAFMVTSGSYSSACEHLIFEELHREGKAVSAINIISYASGQGIPVYSIDATNSAAIIPKLQVAPATMTDIRNALAAGKRVTVPERSVQYQDWHGDGYVVMDMETGAAAYMISGGLAGGGLADLADKVIEFFNAILLSYAIDIINAFRTFVFKVLPGIASKFSEIAGYVALGLSALITGCDMYYNTGELWKGLTAGAVDLIIGWIAAAYIGAIFWAAGGIIAAVVGILFVALIASLIEKLLLWLIEHAWIPYKRRDMHYARIFPVQVYAT